MTLNMTESVVSLPHIMLIPHFPPCFAAVIASFLTHKPRYDYSERQFAFSWGDLVVWIVNNELDLVPCLFAAVVKTGPESGLTTH